MTTESVKNASWNRLRDVLGRALELSDDERETFLEHACAGDTALRRDVDELLLAHADAAGRLGGDGEGPGSSIGPYKLLQTLGEGGFGTVYMAEQREPLRRRVALKVIKLGMDTRQVIARFEAERQALAMMDHPGIAKVLDAGATDSGRPYFVMELVAGVPVTEFCEQNHLGTDERLALFQQVCGAVQHAHQKGIIHRDLKPSNVLAAMHDGVPRCKVIDFGIAKATSGALTDKTLFTEFRQFIGTPEYMSPEQATLGGLDVDTRSDIYSLGVLLYELLTGEPPVDAERLREAAFDEMKRIITEEEPVLPSTRVSTRGAAAAGRAAWQDAGELARSLRGDLDWIVLKALEKDRGRRYATAGELAADLERHRAHEPVSASPPTLAYRTRKFVRRHRGPVAAGAALTLSLVVGIVATSLALREARVGHALARESARAAADEAARRGAVATFLTEVLSTASVAADTGPYREDPRLSALDFLDQAAAGLEESALAADGPSYAQVALALSDAYAEQGADERFVLLAQRALDALGDGDDAPYLYSEAVRHLVLGSERGTDTARLPALRAAALARLEPGVERREDVALEALERWARALARRDPPAGEATARRLLELLERLEPPPIEPVLVRLTLADALRRQGRSEAAEETYGEAREELLAHLAAGRATVLRDALAVLFDSAQRIGLDAVFPVARHVRDAAPRDLKTARVLIRLAWSIPWAPHGDGPFVCGDPAVSLEDGALASTLFSTGLEIVREVLSERHPLVAQALFGIASSLPAERFDEKLATFREAVQLSDLVSGPDAELYGDFARHLLHHVREIGVDSPAARPLIDEAEALVRAAFEHSPLEDVPEEAPWPLFARWAGAELLAEVYRELDVLEPGQGHDRARDHWDAQNAPLRAELLARCESERLGQWRASIAHHVARIVLTMGPPERRDPERARVIARRVVETGRETPGYLNTLATAELACGDAPRALELQRRAAAHWPAGHPYAEPYRRRLAELEERVAQASAGDRPR